MRDITLCLAYYENAKMLERQYSNLAKMHVKVRSSLSLVVVDDGSPDNPAVPPAKSIGIKSFSLFRMLVDVPWNQDACRNLAVHKADKGWVLLTDMDHLVPEKTWTHVMTIPLDENSAYQFARVSEPKYDPYKPHPNSWLMTKALYNRVGGYDERFAGIYGTDGRFHKHVVEIARVQRIKYPIVRVPREVTPDASTTRYVRKSLEGEARRAEVREIIKNSGNRRPKTLSFPWEQVV